MGRGGRRGEREGKGDTPVPDWESEKVATLATILLSDFRESVSW